MNKYEALVIIKTDLSEEDKKSLLISIASVITKNGGTVQSESIWAERRKLGFKIKKQQEGTFYLVNFTSAADVIDKIRYAYKLNDQILRVMVTRL
jgi:ribosomal protein S6